MVTVDGLAAGNRLAIRDMEPFTLLIKMHDVPEKEVVFRLLEIMLEQVGPRGSAIKRVRVGSG